jgi:addiction module RelE/StbE family toxin
LRIRWSRRADCDLDAVAEYLENDDPDAAARVVLRIVDAVEHLADHPHLGRPGRIPNTRELVVSGTQYIVPYRVRGGVLEILRVLHGAMRWPDVL